MGFNYKGATALVTGASSGIGESFVKQLARKGSNLILVARSEDRLNALASEIRAEHGVIVHVLPCDLGLLTKREQLVEEVGALGRPVDLLINNAGFGTIGAFAAADATREREQIDLNVTAVADLMHAYLPGMIERGQGAVINVASTASFQPIPYMSIYAATKAFVRSLSEGVHAECKSAGVTVTALCPGPVDTNFFAATKATGIDALKKKISGNMMTANEVAAAGLKAMEKGKAVIVPGTPNKAGAWAATLVPNRLLTAAVAKIMSSQ